MTNFKPKTVKDFKIILKDLEPYVKNPELLRTGREFKELKLRPREVWGNWLLCVVLRKIYGENITFGGDGVNDGIILDKNTGEWFPLEHVSALDNPFNKQPKGEERIIQAINKKIEKGIEYAKGKWLVVFFDGAEEFFRSKIRENIKGRHGFPAVYCIGLLTVNDQGYTYIVTEYKDSHGDKSKSFTVKINADFTDWEVFPVTE